jgi:tetratricopeptide (TPR) repeat protein
MRRGLIAFALFAPALAAAGPEKPVRAYEGELTIPTYEHSAREAEPPLFGNSTVTGMYPFTTYLMPFKTATPAPHTYHAIFVENEYLKITCIPEFGGRIFSVYDKLRGREMLYRNDVVKPSAYNPRDSWVQSGLELTGPHDLHMLTLHGEPFWSHATVLNPDGSVTLALGETDPVYGMEVQLAATLHPGVAALEISVKCYNARLARMPQMLWINTAISATPETRFLYPMSRTVGHTTAEIADWPVYNGIDYSWNRNNAHMLGVFGIDSYDNYQGAYQFDRNYGIFRFGDRRTVQGMKMWTFGNGETAKLHERGYTDHAGPYVELQSGRYVWDGHYEWVEPHATESWSEWWVPVAGTGGLTTLSRDVALNLELPASGKTEASIALAATRRIPGAHITVRSKSGELLSVQADLDPATPFRKAFAAHGDELGVVVTVTGAGTTYLDYHRPDSNPGRVEYTPYTRPLEERSKPVEQMGVEELVLAAEYRLKELDDAGAADLFGKALAIDPGYSRAHLELGIQDYKHRRFTSAAAHLEKAIARDAYNAEAYYYLALSQISLGEEQKAERNLFFITPGSGFYDRREYLLGRFALIRNDRPGAVAHLERALELNSGDLTARVSLAVAHRLLGDSAAVQQTLNEAERLQPAARLARAEAYLLTGDAGAKAELLQLLGGQTQEALSVSLFYRDLNRWKDAVRLLELVSGTNRDPWGTTPEFYYTLAYCRRKAGDIAGADAALDRAAAVSGNLDRFPFRPESIDPLEQAVKLRPADSTARYLLGCLLYFLERPSEALAQWEAGAASDPKSFHLQRALGLGYAEQGAALDKATMHLRRAIELDPAHVRTFNDLSALYARSGKFDEQLALLQGAFARNPKDDDLAEGIVDAHLMTGHYDDAARLIATHEFGPRHRSYGLRDKYRLLCYAQGADAFNRGDYAAAAKRFEAAAKPPASLGIDDFQSQSSPRQQYYLGRAYEALGRTEDARAAYQRATEGVSQLSGDRDSWNSENFFMVLSLDRLGRRAEADTLAKRFVSFALTEVDDHSAVHRSEARYLLGLALKREGRATDAAERMRGAVDARPDLEPARLELRGDVIDPLPRTNQN